MTKAKIGLIEAADFRDSAHDAGDEVFAAAADRLYTARLNGKWNGYDFRADMRLFEIWRDEIAA